MHEILKPADASDAALRRAEWQRVLFAERPRRSELLRLEPSWPLAPLALRVHRNHSFELVESAMRPFLAFRSLEARATYSDYDDSLSLATGGDAAVEIVWLDFERYRAAFAPAELAAWLAGRVEALRAASAAPVLVANWAAADDAARDFNARLAPALEHLPGVMVCDLAELAARTGENFFSARAAALTGTRIGDAGCVASARELAFRWIPAATAPRLKAVVVDLDHTLYAGVVGEDGPAGVVLTGGHRALQERLLALREQGVFLAVCSRNEEGDARELFRARDDFPLRWESFSAAAVSWEAKAAGLERIARELRVGVDALLFVDDNPGELAAVAAALPGVRTLHAPADAAETLRALDLYPGLWSRGSSREDALRVRDLAAAREREALAAEAADPARYLEFLQARLTLALDPAEHAERLGELSGKTNQFNLALRRLSPVEVRRRLDDPDHAVVSVQLSDRLSDSGIIAALFVRREGVSAVVEELCISCRALGRDLESLLVARALTLATEEWGAEEAVFEHREGPRNGPALRWLERLAGRAVAGEGRVSLPMQSVREAHAASLPVHVEIRRGAHV